MKYKVSDKLPDYDVTVIAWGKTHEGPALAKFRQQVDKSKDKDYWEVVPFYEAQYWTYEGIDSWQTIDTNELEVALDSIIAQGGNLSDEALEVNGINDGRSRLIMYLNSRDIALKALGFNNLKEWLNLKFSQTG